MSSASQLLDASLRNRVDLALVVLAGAVVVAVCLRIRGKRFHGDVPWWLCGFAFASIVIAASLAELVTVLAPAGSPMHLAMARGAILAVGVLTAAVTSVLAGRCACLQAELRVRADVEQQLQSAKNAADEASRAKTDFLAVMSHEMRTPLNAVTGFATLLRETRLDDAQRDYVTTITGEAARLTSLINDILDLTKIEEGRLTLERLPFAPVETAREVLRLLQARATQQNLDLRFEAQIAGPLLVAGDPLRFRQVLVNLVDNAIKFTPGGSVTLFLRWKAPLEAGGAGELVVRVVDTGIGIPAAKLEHLFQMFMQADTSTTRRYGGSGLGLAICQRLVRMMGGEVIVRSTPGKGSEFSFSLPVTPVSPPLEATTIEIAALPPAPARRPRILVVDDMETNRFLLQVFLRRHGFDPELASGGEEAIALATTRFYDAILMDLQMPDLDGYTAARRIRAAETGGRHTPIVALTASITPGTREKCLAAGMDEHMTKPLDLRRFKQLLHDFIAAAAERARATPARSST